LTIVTALFSSRAGFAQGPALPLGERPLAFFQQAFTSTIRAAGFRASRMWSASGTHLRLAAKRLETSPRRSFSFGAGGGIAAVNFHGLASFR